MSPAGLLGGFGGQSGSGKLSSDTSGQPKKTQEQATFEVLQKIKEQGGGFMFKSKKND